MAWKKIIFSGSAGELSSLAVDGNITGTFVGALSSSAQIASDISGSSTSLSASIASDIAAANSGSFSGSFQGNGSALTNITVDQSATIASSFTNQTSVAVNHNFASKNVAVTVYNSSDVLILPASVTLTNDNTATVTFDSSTSGRIVVSKGGHIVSGSVSADSIDGLDDRIKTKLNTEDVVSGSAVQVKTQLGLENVTNESKATMFTNPAFSGTPTAPTAGAFENSTQIATTAFVQGKIAAISTDYDDLTNIPSGIISASAFSSPSQGTVRAAINGANTDVDTGLQAGDSPTFASLTLTGELTVQGTTTSIETANLLVEDKFILLNSGSANPDQGGIIIDEGSGTGHAFIYNNSAARFGFTSSLASNATTVTPDAFASAVIDIDAGHADIAEYQKNGNITRKREA
jgi:Ni,Fe-hydrogenase III small subunit